MKDATLLHNLPGQSPLHRVLQFLGSNLPKAQRAEFAALMAQLQSPVKTNTSHPRMVYVLVVQPRRGGAQSTYAFTNLEDCAKLFGIGSGSMYQQLLGARKDKRFLERPALLGKEPMVVGLTQLDPEEIPVALTLGWQPPPDNLRVLPGQRGLKRMPIFHREALT